MDPQYKINDEYSSNYASRLLDKVAPLSYWKSIGIYEISLEKVDVVVPPNIVHEICDVKMSLRRRDGDKPGFKWIDWTESDRDFVEFIMQNFKGEADFNKLAWEWRRTHNFEHDSFGYWVKNRNK